MCSQINDKVIEAGRLRTQLTGGPGQHPLVRGACVRVGYVDVAGRASGKESFFFENFSLFSWIRHKSPAHRGTAFVHSITESESVTHGSVLFFSFMQE